MKEDTGRKWTATFIHDDDDDDDDDDDEVGHDHDSNNSDSFHSKRQICRFMGEKSLNNTEMQRLADWSMSTYADFRDRTMLQGISSFV
jgi:hypothetical protein